MDRHLKKFPFEFTLDVILEYRFNKKQIKDIQGHIECSENHYRISFSTSEAATDTISLDANKFIYGRFNKVFRIRECLFEGKSLMIDTGESYINHMYTHSQNGNPNTERMLEIDKFRIKRNCATINTDFKAKYYLSNSGDKLKDDFPFNLYSKDNIRDNQNYMYKGLPVVLGYNNESNAPYLELHGENENNLYELLCLLSFYYMRPIRYWMCERCVEKDIVYDFYSVYVSFTKQLKKFNEWNHFLMDIENAKPDALIKRHRINLINLLDFASTAFNDESSLKYKIVLKSIHSFVDILSDSEQSQLVFYVNILSTLAEKLHNYRNSNSASNIKRLFKEVNIPFEGIDDELKKKNFYKTITAPNKCGECPVMIQKNKICTFVDLRNEFVHGLPSKEMLDYIHNSLLLPRLKMAVFKTLLHELGFRNLQLRIPNDPLNMQK
ncbi:MAG: hypothetical protein IKO73_06330 [Bacteroidaceae bacterium]|nr:hypothetical protein [Bacteroidaceae bacterium]